MATKLHFAAQRGDLIEIRRLLESGVDVNVLDEKGNTPLKCASAEPYPEVLLLLIAYGASATLADNRGFTPLHCVAGHGFYEQAIAMAEILLLAGADPNAQSRGLGFVPLHEARTSRMIEWLLAHGANPTIRNDDGETPEEYLRQDDCMEEAETLCKFGESSGRVYGSPRVSSPSAHP